MPERESPPPEKVLPLTKKSDDEQLVAVMLRAFDKNDTWSIVAYAEHASPEVLSNQRVQDEVRRRLEKDFIGGNGYETRRLLKAFPVPEGVLRSPEALIAIHNWIYIAFAGDRLKDAQEMMDLFRIPDEMRTKVVQEAIIEKIDDGRAGVARVILEAFPLDEDVVRATATKGLESLLSRAKFSEARQVEKIFGIPKDIYKTPESRRTIQRGMAFSMVNDDFKIADYYMAEFGFSEEEMQSAALEGVTMALRQGRLDSVEAILKKIPLGEQELRGAYEWGLMDALERRLIPLATDINARLGYPYKVLTQCEELFGAFTTPEAYEAVSALTLEPKSAELINQLRNQFREFQAECLSPEGPSVERMSHDPMLRSYFKSLVRFTDSEWGHHGEEDFKKTLETYVEKQDQMEPLPEELVPSTVLRIHKIDAEAVEKYEPSKEARTRFETFRSATQEALRLVDNPEAFPAFLAGAEGKRDELVDALRSKLAKAPPKGREAIEKRIADLASVDFSMQTRQQESFATLGQFKEFENELRALTLLASLRLNPEQISKANIHVDLTSIRAPRPDDFSWALNFIDHITNKETLRQFFTDKSAADTFKRLLNVKALEDELRRSQDMDTKGTMAMQFVPQRNLLTEFSGHIADACWADTYESILTEFPNISSLTMVMNPEDPKTRRLAGSALLIETRGIHGTPLLVIRGLNPQENIINQLSPRDFVDKLVAYLEPIAQKMGRELAIVIDDHAGGASTNRPMLFTHLNDQREYLPKERLASAKDTTFNDYDITDDTYIIG